MRTQVEKTIVAALVVLCAASTVQAQSYGTERPFVLGTDARVSAMGGSGVNMRGSAALQFYNPANLSSLQWDEFVFFRTVLYDSDAQYNALSYGHPFLGFGTVGATILRLDVGGIEERDATNQLLGSDLSDTQTRVLLGYGHTINRSLSVGFNFKIDHQSFGGFSASGVGLDVGVSGQRYLQGNRFLESAKVGVVIRNLIEPSLKLDQDNVPDPTEVVAGAAFVMGSSDMRLETTLDFIKPSFSPFKVQFGQDVRYREHFAMRFGVDGGDLTAGFGARYKSVELDYAYRNTDLGSNNSISLAVRFGKSVDERRTRARAELQRRLNNEITQRLQILEERQLRAALAAGDSLFDAGRFAKARDHYEVSLMWDPENEHAGDRVDECRYRELVGLARTSIVSEDYARGLFYAHQAQALRPSDSAAIAAAKLCRERLADSKSRVQMVDNLLSSSIDLYASGNYADALRGFEEVLKLTSDNTLASQYRQKSRIQLAEAVERLIRRAKAAAAEHDYNAAFALLEQASRIDPGNKDVAAVSAHFREQRDKRQPTVAKPPVAVPRSTARTAELEVKYSKGLEAFNHGKLDIAVQLLSGVWMADPGYDEAAALLMRAHLLLGMAGYSDDQYDVAIRHWRRALEVDPNNMKAKRYIRRAEEEIRRLDRVSN